MPRPKGSFGRRRRRVRGTTTKTVIRAPGNRNRGGTPQHLRDAQLRRIKGNTTKTVLRPFASRRR